MIFTENLEDNSFTLTELELIEKFPYKRYSRAEDPKTGKRMYSVDGTKLPSVTTILGATKDKESIEALERWKQRVGEEGAEKIKNDAASMGTEMHLVIEKYLEGEGYLNISEKGNRARKMAHTILKNISGLTEVWGNEISLAFPEKFAGATDCIGVIDDKVTIFDWKQTNKPKRREWSAVQDYFTQLGAYSLAHESMYGKIDQVKICMCSRDFNYQEFSLEGQELKDYQDKWWERFETYLKVTS